MYHVCVTTATNLGANVKVMTGGSSTFDNILSFNEYRHMTSVAVQTFQLVCCVCEVLKTLGVAGTAEQVTTT
jgi:hypothetical protein